MNKMNKLTLLSLVVLMISVVGCDTTANTAAGPEDGTAPRADDAQSQVRQDQLNSDIRAREQRNQAGGDQMERADGDLESEVRSKLEANIPGSKLAVDAEDGAVTISGTVPSQDQLDKVETLAREIKGVNQVAVQATVAQ
jgi:hyperosmotically inducible periplasmic protein